MALAVLNYEDVSVLPFADEDARWIDDLAGDGPRHHAAVERLHDLLMRAARFEVRRRMGNDPAGDDLAAQAADDATVAVLAKLHTFRGASRFTTWAYKFALLEAAVAVRRREWRGRDITFDSAAWDVIPDAGVGPEHAAETTELLAVLREAIDEVLSPHQREVLLAVAVGDVPIDVLAERLTTTRGALYKTIHDARRKLRAELETQGLHP